MQIEDNRKLLIKFQHAKIHQISSIFVENKIYLFIANQ